MPTDLPDPLVVKSAGGLDDWGVQRNFESLAQMFPLGPENVKTRVISAAGTTDLTLTTAFQDVAGTSVTLTAPGFYGLVGVVTFVGTGAGWGFALGVINTGGSDQGDAVLNEAANSATVSQLTGIQVTGSTVVKLRARKTTAAGTVIAQCTAGGTIASRTRLLVVGPLRG